MDYRKTLLLSKDVSNQYYEILNKRQENRGDIIARHNVVFNDGTRMEIRIRGAKDVYPWTEAALFKGEKMVRQSQIELDFMRTWKLRYGGNTYTAIVAVSNIDLFEKRKAV